jgi:cellobiose epimerase
LRRTLSVEKASRIDAIPICVSHWGEKMITRREFTKVAAMTGIASTGLSKVAHALPLDAESPSVAIAKVPRSAWINHIDPDWVQKTLVGGLLDYWLKASVMPNGFIQENLDRDWKPWGTQREASLNGQGRQLYCMAMGYELTKRKDYLDAVHKSADFLLKMRDPEYGGFYNRMTPDLKVIDDTKTGFTSFTITPLAHIARITGEKKYADEAMRSWHEVSTKMRDGQFFYNSMKRDFSGPQQSNIGNPAGAATTAGARNGVGAGFAARRHGLNVHMFEALLALYEATKDKTVWDEIQTELEAMAKMFDHERGYLPEGFDENWKAAVPKTYNTGHLFEWPSLFSRAVEFGADPKFIDLGSRSIDTALKAGLDPATGGVWMNSNVEGGPARKYMIWWAECETMKATARYAILHGRSDLWPVFDRCLEFVRTNFFDREHGGWFEGVIPGEPREALGERAYIKGAVDGPEWGSYHQTSCFTDLLHLTRS